MMRNRFDTQLQLLNNSLITMGALCEQVIACAVKALVNGDNGLAEKAIEADREIDHKEKEIESLCLKLLLEQQPVARDLRAISSALKMITDMERIGDQGADIAEIVQFTDLTDSGNRVHITGMAEAVIKMVTDGIDAFVKKDLELAQAVIEYDDIVDRRFSDVRTAIIELISKDPGQGEQAVDILMIAKYLERIGDHATNIAEWVAFSITGKHVE